jgi:hypothetical protein
MLFNLLAEPCKITITARTAFLRKRIKFIDWVTALDAILTWKQPSYLLVGHAGKISTCGWHSVTSINLMEKE